MTRFHIASASGNVFGYFWADEVPASFDGPAWARALCPRGTGFGLDGIFLLQRPGAGPWVMDHWDVDGGLTFCSNGTRAALGLDGAPAGEAVEVRSTGEAVRLRRDAAGVGLRMPEGPGYGLRPLPFAVEGPAGFGFVGNPQLVLRVPEVDAVELPVEGPRLRWHEGLEGGTNVNWIQVQGPGRARIRSWERGVEGETLSCGTGSAVTGAWLASTEGVSRWTLENRSPDPVTVEVQLQPDGGWRELWVSGPVRRIGAAEPDPSLLRGTC